MARGNKRRLPRCSPTRRARPPTNPLPLSARVIYSTCTAVASVREEGAVDLLSLITTGSVTNTGNLITNLLFCVCAVILLGELRPTVRAVATGAAEVLLLFGLSSALEVLQHELTGSSTSLPSLSAALALYALLQRRYTATDRLVRCVTFVSAFLLIASMTGVMRTAFPVLKRADWGQMVPSAVSYVAMFVFAFVIRRFSIAHFSFVPRYFVVLILLTDVLGAYAGYSFITYNVTHMTEEGATYSSIVLSRYELNAARVNVQIDATFLLLMLVAYLMFYVLASEHAQRAELLVTKKSDADSMSQMLVTRQLYDSIREARHELKNYNAYMRSLLDADDYDGLRSFFAAYSTELEGVLDYVSSGNRMVDAVVNAKMALARSRGIEMKTMLAVPAELTVEDDDMFRLLANLLDNAIEATPQSRTPAGPIKLKILPQGGYFFISVQNPCDARRVRRGANGALVTSKREGDLHGYGTKVIREIAEKYHGSATFKVEDQVFTASVMIVAQAKKGEE